MSKKVGIPRSLFYYKYFPLWKTFFEELGAEIIVSDNTSKRILDDGVKSCVDEACLPVKLFHGHVINLKDRVDCLFIPRFTSISKNEYVCPEFGGLPDMIRYTIDGLPELIDTEINLRRSKRNALKAVFDIGRRFTGNEYKIWTAYRRALRSYRDFKCCMKRGELPCEILERYTDIRYQASGSCISRPIAETAGTIPEYDIAAASAPQSMPDLKIAVIGHVYNLNDSYINLNLVDKLRSSGAGIITTDMVSSRIIRRKINMLNKRVFWNFGSKALGTVLHLLDDKNKGVDGIIYLMSFGCGIDSFICDLAERRVRRNGDIPFMILMLDELSGEAGIDTRIEAFIDMVKIKKNKSDMRGSEGDDDNIPAHGEYIYLHQGNA